ncbi:MAG: SH3 domain-containing protein [Treponema sp.]|nr:SH3 domain-containing protein [Treponema sp.]
MKNLLFLLGLVMFLSSCSKENNVESASRSERNNKTEAATENLPEQELKITKYVKAPAGLRVRNSPDINAERIGVLDDLTEVLVLKKDGNNLTIDGISGKWTLIETYDIQGWVFGGFLSLMPLRVKDNAKSNLDDMITFFENYFNFRELRGANSIEEFITIFGALSENKKISSRTFDAPYLWGGTTIDETVIVDAPYKLVVYGKSLLMSLRIELSEDNFMDLFPYRTLEEYLSDGNFGNNTWTWTEGEDEFISLYRWDEEGWRLEFKNGLLHRIAFYQFIT